MPPPRPARSAPLTRPSPRGEEGDDAHAEHEASEEYGARLVSHHRAAYGIDAVCPQQAPNARVADYVRAVAPADAVEYPVRRDHAGEPHDDDVAQPQQARLSECAGREQGEVLWKGNPTPPATSTTKSTMMVACQVKPDSPRLPASRFAG